MKTKGATSHVDVRLGDLTQVLAPDAIVRVSRSWANAIGLDGARPTRREEPKKVAVQVEQETKLEVGVDNW